MDWDDKPGLPKLVIPIRFRCLLALFGQKLRSKIAQSGPTGIATVTATLYSATATAAATVMAIASATASATLVVLALQH